MEKILEIKGLTKTYKNFELKDINLTLEKGYIHGLIGPNGSGKTTSLKLILDLLNPDQGEVKIFGMNSRKNPIEVKSRIGIVYDESPYFPNLSLLRNAKAVSGFYSTWDQELFLQYLKQFDLNPKTKLQKLSKGMKTKFSIAMALSHRPALLIMDEPTAGLDPVFRNELLELLQSIIETQEISILFSTHITSDLDKVADYVTYIQDGSMVLSDSMENVHETYKLIKGKKDILQSLPSNTLLGVRENEYGFSALAHNVDLFSNEQLKQLVIEPVSLEDIMIYYDKKEGSHESI